MTLNRIGIETRFTWNLYTGCVHGCTFCCTGIERIEKIERSPTRMTADKSSILVEGTHSQLEIKEVSEWVRLLHL